MPNGKYDPQCDNCKFFLQAFRRRTCRRHKFVVPLIAAFPICRDIEIRPAYAMDGRHFGYFYDFVECDEFLSLERGYLYCRCVLTVPLGRFSELKNLYVDPSVNEDPEFGWSVYIQRFHRKHFARPGTELMIDLDGKQHPAVVVKAERERVWRSSPTLYGTWVHDTKAMRGHLIRLLESPRPLYDWLERHYRMEAILSEWKDDRNWHNPDDGVCVLAEIVKKRQLVRLHPYKCYYSEDLVRVKDPIQTDREFVF